MSAKAQSRPQPSATHTPDRAANPESGEQSSQGDTLAGRQLGLVKRELQNLKNANRANSFMDRGVEYAVGILVIGLLAAYLLPVAINEIVGVDTSSWGSAEAQLFGLLPIFFVLGILLYIVNKAT